MVKLGLSNEETALQKSIVRLIELISEQELINLILTGKVIEAAQNFELDEGEE